MRFDPSIFKAYDIRGVAPDTVDEPLAHALGLAFGRKAAAAGERKVAVGRDGRLSSPALAAALIRGLAASGVDVVDLGAVTTPMMNFAASTVCASGVQVTASHNPKDYNGFKLVLRGQPVCGEELQQLHAAIERGDFAEPPAPGSVRRLDISSRYLERIAGEIRLARPMKVVLDCGNGIGGASAPQVLRAIGCDVVELFSEVDGNFPNHHPDPGQPANLQALIAKVKESGAELGLALDGDGDRLGVVTASGNIIYPDRQMMVFARDVLARTPGAPILFDVKSTQQLPAAIAAAGGQPVMCKSGYSLLKARMLESGAPLAGEMSGHIFFNDRWYGFDDGTYCGCRLLEILSREADAGCVLDALPASYSTPELNIRCREGEAHEVAAELAIRARFPEAQVCTLDGVRVDWPDGFGLVRASNTTPVLVLRFEGQTPAAMQRIQGDMLALLRSVKPDAALAPAAH